MARVVIRTEVIEAGELKLVSRAALKTAMRRLRDNPDVGKPLTRTLAGLRSLRVDGSENRIVYRNIPSASDEEGMMVEVLVIGRRRDNEAYRTAETRR